MAFFRFLILLFLFVFPVFAFDKMDKPFEVQPYTQKRLPIIVHPQEEKVFDPNVDSRLKAALENNHFDKDKLRKFGLSETNHQALKEGFSGALADAGLDADEIAELFSDMGFNEMMEMLAAYDVVGGSTLKKALKAQGHWLTPFITSLSVQARGLGLGLAQWAVNNPAETLEALCDAVNIAVIAGVKNTYVMGAAMGCGCLGHNPRKTLAKAHTFFTKSHKPTGGGSIGGGGGKGGGKSTGLGGGSSGGGTKPTEGETKRAHPGTHERIMPPETLPAFPKLVTAKAKTPLQGGGGKRKRWKDDKGLIYEWDYRHGTLEKYSKTGKKHLGEFDPNTGRQLKDGDPSRLPVEP